jgi:hypothetical protein
MKRAYLFGAAALLILLIVVAYVSFSREKKDGDVCVRPPPQVGPTADPVVRALAETFSEEGDEDEEEIPLILNRPKQERDPAIGGPLLVDPLLQSSACMSPVLVRPQLVTPGTPEFEPWSSRELFEARLFALEKAVAIDMRRLPDIEDKLVGLEEEMLRVLEVINKPGYIGDYTPLETIEEERMLEY